MSKLQQTKEDLREKMSTLPDSAKEREKRKNKVDIAKEDNDASKYNNQKRVGSFVATWAMRAITGFTIIIGLAFAIYVARASLSQEELGTLLKIIYRETGEMVDKYQAAIAAVAGLAFGKISKK